MLATAVGGGCEEGGPDRLAGNTAAVASGKYVEWQNVPHSSLTIRQGEMLRLWYLFTCSLVGCMWFWASSESLSQRLEAPAYKFATCLSIELQ